MCEDCDKDELGRLLDEIEQIDVNGLKIIPDGADKPLKPATEADWVVTPEDVKKAIKAWNEKYPQYAGMLEARIVTSETKPKRRNRKR